MDVWGLDKINPSGKTTKGTYYINIGQVVYRAMLVCYRI